MTYPVIAAILLGVSFATLLYYMFSENSEEYQQPQNSRRSHENHGALEQYWNADDSNNYQRRRHDWYNRGGYNRGDECIICLSNMREDPDVRIQPCGHMFHYLCITSWKTLGPEGSGALCPICRHPLKITPI